MRAAFWSYVLLAAAVIAGSAACGDGDSPIAPSPTCTFSISPATQSFSPEGGTGTVTVSTATGCGWTATAPAWITIMSGATGTGPGSVNYAVTTNSGEQARNGSLTVAGHTHAVTQEGRTAPPCTYSLSPANAEIGVEGADGTFNVTATGACAWAVVSNASWISIRSGASGTGSGTVTYRAERNPEIQGREGTITVADLAFRLRQGGDASRCEYGVSPVDLQPCMAGGTLTATVTTQAGCPWTVSTNVPWLTMPGGESGTGSGTLTIAFTDNHGPPRDGIVMVRWPTPTAGQNVRVAQAGCFYSVTQSSIGFTAAGGSGRFDVIQFADPNSCGGPTQDRCVWTAESNVPWITITSPMPRSGDNPVTFAVAPNEASTARSGTITVRDKVVAVTQAGR